ncbi:MAG TPA: DMT family transporter [Mycobacteriales bacterium]|nr:DMT family transporter [Mycobacteriales bacterium]
MLSPLGILAFGLAFVTALCFAGGYVLQYHEAHQAPDRLFLSPRMLIELARHRVWVAGIVIMIIGSGVEAAALAAGSLAIVEPILCTSLLFALPLSAAWRRERLSRRDWTGAIAVCLGLGLLLGVGSPSKGLETMPQSQWLLVLLAAWGAALACVAAAKRCAGAAPRAALIGAASGIIAGLQDALTRYSMHEMSSRGFLALMITWVPYAQIVGGVYSLSLMQSAYQAGPLTAGLPPIAVGQPVTGMLIGVFAFNEHLHASPVAMTFELLGAAVMVAGTWTLGRSPLVLGRHHPTRIAQEALAQAHVAVQQLEAKLQPVKEVARRPAWTRARLATLQAVSMVLIFRRK